MNDITKTVMAKVSKGWGFVKHENCFALPEYSSEGVISLLQTVIAHSKLSGEEVIELLSWFKDECWDTDRDDDGYVYTVAWFPSLPKPTRRKKIVKVDGENDLPQWEVPS